MSEADDDHAISYQALPRGVPVVTSDGQEIGTVHRVQDNTREHIFDGIVMRTADGTRFVDAPEVARITRRQVTLRIDAAEARELPEPSAVQTRAQRGGAPLATLAARRPLACRRWRRTWRSSASGRSASTSPARSSRRSSARSSTPAASPAAPRTASRGPSSSSATTPRSRPSPSPCTSPRTCAAPRSWWRSS